FLGAEVIKVENAATPEEMRAYGGTDINHAPFFLSINPEILSVDLDIKTPARLDRLRDLIGRSDIVINNLRPGAIERQGLSYDDLKAIKSDIISVSIKMWGNDGPLGYQTGYAPCFAALAGLASVIGIQIWPLMAAIRVRVRTGSRSPSPTTRNGIGCATLWAQACSPTTRGTRHLRG